MKSIAKEHLKSNTEFIDVLNKKQLFELENGTKIRNMENSLLSSFNGYEDYLDYWAKAELTKIFPKVRKI